MYQKKSDWEWYQLWKKCSCDECQAEAKKYKDKMDEYDRKELEREEIKKALKQVERGEVKSRGSFAKYVE